MKILFIGGTGLISSACADLAVQRGHDLTLLNRSISAKYSMPPGAQRLVGDVRGDPAHLAELLKEQRFDAVVDWIAYTPSDIQRDIRLFSGKTRQFVFISSASAYQKPPAHYLITEETPLGNPFWQYSRDKIACEEILMRAWQQQGFPVTIIRPSLTYGPSQIPLCVNSWAHPYTLIERMQRGKKIIVPGDGSSLWVLTWNEDFAKGLVGLLGREEACGEAFQITSDEVLTWDQIYRETAHALALDIDIVHVPSELIAAYDAGMLGSLIGDKANSSVFDNSKVKRYVPDFVCEVPWAEGVRRALAWHAAEAARRSVDTKIDGVWDQIITAYEKAFPQ